LGLLSFLLALFASLTFLVIDVDSEVITKVVSEFELLAFGDLLVRFSGDVAAGNVWACTADLRILRHLVVVSQVAEEEKTLRELDVLVEGVCEAVADLLQV
jgi:hypothetical protein